jgi:hypothetical protein
MLDREPPQPVQGEVFATSRGMLIFLALGSLLLGLASGFVLWDTWSHDDTGYVLPFHLAKDSLFTSFVVGLGAFGGIGCFIAFLCQSFFPKQLIFGEEVLQVVRPKASGSIVETQVPYRNIAAVACEREDDGSRQLRVGIDLLDPAAPGTYSCRDDFGKKAEIGRDLILPGYLTVGPEEIARLLMERCKKKTAAGGE